MPTRSFTVFSRAPYIRVGVLLAFQVLALPSTARADGIDLSWFTSRLGGSPEHIIRTAGLVILLLAFNYGLNFLVIGVPVNRTRAISRSFVLTDLIGFTLIAQVVDIFGGFLGFLLGALLATLLVRGETQMVVGFMLGLALDFNSVRHWNCVASASFHGTALEYANQDSQAYRTAGGGVH